MTPTRIQKVSFIGAGNIAHHLSQNFIQKGIQIHQIVSKSHRSASDLSKLTHAQAIKEISEIDSNVDLIIIAVNDDAIQKVVLTLSKNTELKNILIAHSSGKVSSEIFKNHFPEYGVFYPLQSFSKKRSLDISTVPFCIYGNTEKSQKLLKGLAEQMSKHIYMIDDKDRSTLHLAAVFANNFSNHMFSIARTLCEKENVDFEILKALIQETALKLNSMKPEEAQTGPAIRNDKETIDDHIQMLKNEKTFLKIYKLITKSIQKKKT